MKFYESFDSNFYLKQYPELKKIGVINKIKAKYHFINKGFYQGYKGHQSQLNKIKLELYQYLSNLNKFIFKNYHKFNDFYISENILKYLYQMNKIDFFKYLQNNFDSGLLLNEKQINKFYSCKFKNDKIELNNKLYNYSEFKKKFFDEKTFQELSENIIINKLKNNTKTNYQTIFLIHIGDNKKGNYILDNIIKNDLHHNNIFYITTNNEFNIHQYTDKLEYIYYQVKNLGNDIIPSLKIYLDNQNIGCQYILKLHTKSNNKIFYSLTNFFINDYNKIISLLNTNDYEFCTKKKFCLSLIKDKFNRKLISNAISTKNCFCAITFFMGKKNIFQKNIQKCNSLLKASLINNFYYDNYFFLNNSPVHAIERIISSSTKILIF